MDNRYIMIQGGVVTNIIVTTDKANSEEVLHCTLIEMTPELVYDIGWIWDGTQFIDPAAE